MYLNDIFTIPANLVGLPGMSQPCGFTSDPKLPIGLQLLAPAFEEAKMLRAAHAYERATEWRRARPNPQG
jgi:aspartyl-tRNA(Asn)/glutamyl-tRNA(Gln) amidotransferase subunit A